MSERWFVPEDTLEQQMENELLTFEVEFLRAGLKHGAGPAHTEGVGRRIDELEAELTELRKARSDLRWLLGRLHSSPLRFVLLRFGGYRTLVDRWLEG